MMNGFSIDEIEQATISALFQWPEECMRPVQERGITPEHFSTFPNRTMFERLTLQWSAGKPIDLVGFTHELRRDGLLEKIGGAYYVTHTFADVCHSPKVIGYYLDIIEEAHAKKLLSTTCQDSAQSASEPATEAESAVSETMEAIAAIPLPSRHRERRTLAEAISDKLDRMEKGEQGEDILLTGLTKLDEASPLRKGDMPLIAGERKAGKSILALSIVLNVAKRGVPVLYFSLEDTEAKVVDRLFAAVSRIPINQHHSKSLEKTKLDESIAAGSKLRALPIYIKDNVMDLPVLMSIAREHVARYQIGLIVIDYAQLVRTKEAKDVNREQKVAEISRSIRLLAMELNVPIILLSQLNADSRTRESRALEQDATAMWEIQMDGKEEEQVKRWIAIPWQRNGQSGVAFAVTFLGEIARVENRAEEQQ